MDAVSVIALCSLGVSVLTTIFMLMGQRHTAKTDYVQSLETRIESLERELKESKDRIKELEDHNGTLMRENLALLRQIAKDNA